MQKKTPGVCKPSLREKILFAVTTAPVILLSDLRRELGDPPAFDEVVLRLADERKLIAMSDCDALSVWAQGGVRDNDSGRVLTCIARAN